MRRRSPINVWPSLADLMTILAVPALFTAVGVLPLLGLNGSGERSVQQLFVETKPKPDQKQQAFGINLEHVRNRRMFWATQRFQRLIVMVKAKVGGDLGPAQTLVFGNDLLTYGVGETRIQNWHPEGRKKLKNFCQALTDSFEGKAFGEQVPEDIFMIHVEGHADSIACRGDSNCNWRISSKRAMYFVETMRDPAYCPGGKRLHLLPIGHADLAPVPGGKPSRRIALRVVANYDRMIKNRHPILKFYGTVMSS